MYVYIVNQYYLNKIKDILPIVNNAQKKWLKSMCSVLQPEHRIETISRCFGIEPYNCSKYLVRPFSKGQISDKVSHFILYNCGKAHFKVDYERQFLMIDDLIIKWDNTYFIKGDIMIPISLPSDVLWRLFNEF